MTTRFGVWAPRPSRVALVVDGRTVAMERQDSNWWIAECDVDEDTRYGFTLDYGSPLADPRSRSQPEGIRGLSALDDPGGFAWSDDGWRGMQLDDAVIYEAHVGTFSANGTFDGMLEHLDHLCDLGVTALELMPVAEFPGEHGWGYDGVLLFAPHHHYGGPDGLRRLVDACHARGLAVMLDVVYNHVGPSGNHLSEFGPYFTDEHTSAWGQAVNFDGPGSHEVRRFVVDNACSWVRDYHVDGLRLDAVHAISDRSAIHIVEELVTEVARLADSLGRSVCVVAESNLNDPRFVRPPKDGGYGADAAWSDEWHHALHTVLTGESDGYYRDFGSVDQLGTALRQGWIYDGRYSPFRDAIHGRSPEGLDGARFVVATQTHDQVGNRARGERLAHLTSPARSRIAAALLCTSPFVPMLFQGEEWAASTPFQYFTDHDDPEIGAAVSEGRCTEFASFGWAPSEVPDPQDPSTFRRSVLDWSETDVDEHRAMLEWYRALLALRGTHDALGTGCPASASASSDAGHLTFTRGPIGVLCNLGTSDWLVASGVEVLLASGVEHDDEQLAIHPDGVAIVQRSGQDPVFEKHREGGVAIPW